MARTVSVSKLQEMQRAVGSVGGDPLEMMINPEDVETQFTDDDVDEMAQEAGIQPKAEDQADETPWDRLARSARSPVNPDRADIAEQLQALGVIADCDADMARGEIGGKVRVAVEEAGLLADHDEIERETDRIWGSFGYAKSDGGPRVYDVDASGQVSDFRRPDPGPQRDPFEPPVHQVGDDDQRFSGAGASDQHRMSAMIPQDSAFQKRQFMLAPALQNLAEELIERHGFLEQLEACELEFKWQRLGTNSNGKRSIGTLKRVSGVWADYCSAQFVIYLAADTARLANFTDRQVEAALFHQLLHIGKDKKGNWIRVGHDFEGFGTEVRHYGPWTEDLKIGGQAFTAAHQMGLFDQACDDEDDDEAEDDGAGVLIHNDGSPMTAEEIEAQEAAELADDDDDVEAFEPEEDGDEDASGSSTTNEGQEEEDPLADLPI